MSSLRYALILIVVLSTTAGLATAGPRGEPVLSVSVPDAEVTPGEEATVGVYILNSGNIDIGGSLSGRR